MGTREAEAVAVLHSGCIHLLRALQVVDSASGLTPARLSALSVLVFSGPKTLGALARAEGVTGPTMTRIVDGLVAEGLVERRPDLRDGRARSLTASQSGRNIMRAAARRRLAALTRGLRELPHDEQEALLEAAGALDKVAAAVRATSARKAR